MNVPSPVDVTELLMDWSNGNRAALDRLMPLVYDELHRLAARQIRKESPGHTLQTTVLVNGPIYASSSNSGALAEPRAVLWHCRPTDAPHPG
jgi:hypothetical protein